MSVSDPLIKELKGYTRRLVERGADVTDDAEELAPFCKCLEKCLQKGVSTRLNVMGVPIGYPEAWQWMEDIARRRSDELISYSSIVEDVMANQKVQERTGKLRLLVRTCLNRKCLHVPIGYLVRTPYIALDYYRSDSILGDEILGEILYSVCLQISNVNFRLNLRNAMFLDDTWELADCFSVEFVPCKTLGISVCFTRGKTLIIKIEKNSVVGEDERIEVGDVLDEINGQVISSQTRGNLHKMMNKSSCLPIKAHVVKHRIDRTNEIFAPIANVIKSSGLDHMKRLLESAESDSERAESRVAESPGKKNGAPSANIKPGYLLDYCGSIDIGSEGDVRQIERALRRLLRPGNVSRVPIRFECLELGIKVTRDFDDKEIVSKSYMDISSCGRSGYFPYYFAFICGETNCSVAKSFEAHVFYHKNDIESQTILQSLGQGFYRTHFAV